MFDYREIYNRFIVNVVSYTFPSTNEQTVHTCSWLTVEIHLYLFVNGVKKKNWSTNTGWRTQRRPEMNAYSPNLSLDVSVFIIEKNLCETCDITTNVYGPFTFVYEMEKNKTLNNELLSCEKSTRNTDRNVKLVFSVKIFFKNLTCEYIWLQHSFDYRLSLLANRFYFKVNYV